MNNKIYIDSLEQQAQADGLPYELALDNFLNYLIRLFDVEHFRGGLTDYKKRLSAVLHEKPIFGALAIRWLADVSEAMERGTWLDAFGTLYEKMYLSRGKASKTGQFFTPHGLCDLMAAVSETPDGSGCVNDCAAGSGRLLLAHYLNVSGVRHEEGRKYQYDAQDSDPMAAKMCALNVMAHGMFGRVECRDTLLWNTPSAVYVVNEVRYPFPSPYYSIRFFSPKTNS